MRTASDRIEEIVGLRPVTLAYPGGSYDAAVTEALEAEAIQLAFTTEYGALTSTSNPLAAPRIRVHGTQSAVSVTSAVSHYGDGE